MSAINKFAFLVSCWLAGGALEALAFQTPAHESLPDFDVRVRVNPNSTALSAAHEAGVKRLRDKIADLQVGVDERQPRPNFVSRRNGFLTGSDGGGAAISKATLNAIPTTDPHRVVKAFLNKHAAVFGHDSSPLTNAAVLRDFVWKNNGVRTTVWQQQQAGLPVFEATVQAHVTKRGELVNLASRFVAPSKISAAARQPKLNTTEAVSAAAAALGATNAGKTEFAPSLIWLPLEAATLRLCWDVTLTAKARGETFRLLVDAQTGEVLIRRCLTEYLAASYRVFTNDSPTPFSPGWTSPITNQPPPVARSLVTFDALNTNASPEGWVPDWSTETLGNNVDAHADRNGDNVADLPRPQCTAGRVFDFPLDLNSHPTNAIAASVVQLFYWCNWMHDRLYELGFDEASGNFQADNYGRGGSGGDAVQADGQDGSGVNNANMTTLADGIPPRMQMYLWNGATPNRDGDLDAELVLHEYTHGLSWRLVGGGVGISAMQTQGMGEGWSDFYALALLSQPGDDPQGCYALGGYTGHLFGGQPYSYYFGIRRYPYSTDLTKNPLTFGHLSQQVYDGSIPRNPTMTSTQQTSPAEVHNQGEVWCSALWEVRANLIVKHGFATGNQLALRLVTDGMKLSPPEPNFLQARDAILQADLVDNGGANRNEIWAGFAKRGLGFSATSPNSSMTAGVVEAFDNGDPLQVAPVAAFASSGNLGGLFTPGCQSFTLTNAGTNVISWAAVHSQPWLEVSPAAGVLATGATVTVSACFNATANTLALGNHTDTLAFSNGLTGMLQVRNVSLAVLPTERVYYFTFDTDPGWTKNGAWAFGHPTGAGGGSYGFADPANGATGANVYGVNLAGNYSTTVGAQFNLTTPALNLSGKSNCVVQFQRWLNSDDSLYVSAEIYLSTNGTAFTRIWANGLATMENAWSKQRLDLSALADNQPAVYLRWSYRILKTGARAMSGWNLDDVEILAAAPTPTNQVLACAPDLNSKTLNFSWPTATPGFVLQQNTNLATANWVNLTNGVAIVGTNYQLTVSLTNDGGFFRLMHP